MPRNFEVPANDGDYQRSSTRRVFNAIAYSIVALVLAIGIVAALGSALVVLQVLGP